MGCTNYTVGSRKCKTPSGWRVHPEGFTGNQWRRGPFDKGVYRLRNLVERLINRLKHYRRLATRYLIICCRGSA
jgi:transposase